MSKEYIFRASSHSIVKLDGNILEIQRKGFLRRDFSLPNRKIDINNVLTVKYRDADAFNFGYIYFVVKTDEIRIRSGDMGEEREETTIWFGRKEQKLAEEIRNYVENILDKKDLIKAEEADEEYIVENEVIRKHIKYYESLKGYKMTKWEKQLFEWAYIQGKND
jgi:hypothetical protein